MPPAACAPSTTDATEFSHSHPPLTLRFQIKWRPPRGRDVRLFVVGSVPELGQVKFRMRDIKRRFNDAVRTGFEKWIQSKEEKRSRMVDNMLEEDDSEDSDSEYAINLDTVNKSTAVDMYLEETFHLLNPDEELGIEDLYTTEDVQITTQSPGACFSYAFVVWRLDTNTLWDFELFNEARWMAVPAYNRTRNPKHMFIVRCERLHDRREIVKDNLYDLEPPRMATNPCEPDSEDDY